MVRSVWRRASPPKRIYGTLWTRPNIWDSMDLSASGCARGGRNARRWLGLGVSAARVPRQSPGEPHRVCDAKCQCRCASLVVLPSRVPVLPPTGAGTGQVPETLCKARHVGRLHATERSAGGKGAAVGGRHYRVSSHQARSAPRSGVAELGKAQRWERRKPSRVRGIAPRRRCEEGGPEGQRWRVSPSPMQNIFTKPCRVL